MPVRRPTGKVWIGGTQFQLLDRPGAVELGWVAGQPIAGGTLKVVRAPFAPEIKMPVVVEWGFDHNHIYGFHGFVVNPRQAAYPNSWSIQVKDILWLADFPKLGDPINLLNNKTANEVAITLLCDYAGIPFARVEIPPLEQDPGVPWLMGTMTPILINGSPLAGVVQLCDVLGYRLYADEGGVVRAIKMTGAPSVAPVAYWQEGRDWLVSGAPESDSDGEKIYTRVIVTGASTNIITGPSGEQQAIPVRDIRQVDNHPYLPDGKHRELTYNNSFIEFTTREQGGEASCEAVAERLILEHSRTPYTVTARIKTDPRLGITQTVAGRQPRLEGMQNYRSFFLMGLNRSFGGGTFDDSVTLDGGVGEAGYSPIPDPIASFVWILHQETLVDGDWIEVFLDGAPSKGFGEPGEVDDEGVPIPPDPGEDPLDTIQSYYWEDNSDPPQSATGRKAMFKYPSTQQQARICLTVIDVTGKDNTFCTVINLAGDVGATPSKRELSLAAGLSWYVTPDGGKNWRQERAQYTEAVAPISSMGSIAADVAAASAVGFLSAGNSTGGGIRSTIDYLATPSVTLNAGGTIATKFIWQHEKFPERIWQAYGDQAFLSINGGTTFFPKCRPIEGSPVVWIVESVDQVGLVDFLAGPNLYTSWDEGAHLTLTLEGPPGSVARNYVSGHGKHWVGYTSVPEGSSPLRSAEGDIAAFPVLDPPVNEIRALTIMVDRPLLVVVDNQGRIWTLDNTGSTAVHVATMPD